MKNILDHYENIWVVSIVYRNLSHNNVNVLPLKPLCIRLLGKGVEKKFRIKMIYIVCTPIEVSFLVFFWFLFDFLFKSDISW